MKTIVYGDVLKMNNEAKAILCRFKDVLVKGEYDNQTAEILTTLMYERQYIDNYKMGIKDKNLYLTLINDINPGINRIISMIKESGYSEHEFKALMWLCINELEQALK